MWIFRSSGSPVNFKINKFKSGSSQTDHSHSSWKYVHRQLIHDQWAPGRKVWNLKDRDSRDHRRNGTTWQTTPPKQQEQRHPTKLFLCEGKGWWFITRWVVYKSQLKKFLILKVFWHKITQNIIDNTQYVFPSPRVWLYFIGEWKYCKICWGLII